MVSMLSNATPIPLLASPLKGEGHSLVTANEFGYKQSVYMYFYPAR
jgi:hypothetical protein